MPAKKENRMRKEFEEKDIHQEVRLNKYLSEAGVCSRREADRLIEEGKVFVDGVRAENGRKVTDEMEITVNGKRCSRGQKMVLLAFHKPEGVVCTTDRRWNDVTPWRMCFSIRHAFFRLEGWIKIPKDCFW